MNKIYVHCGFCGSNLGYCKCNPTITTTATSESGELSLPNSGIINRPLTNEQVKEINSILEGDKNLKRREMVYRISQYFLNHMLDGPMTITSRDCVQHADNILEDIEATGMIIFEEEPNPVSKDELLLEIASVREYYTNYKKSAYDSEPEVLQVLQTLHTRIKKWGITN